MKRLSRLDESKLFDQLNKAETNDATARHQLAGNVRWVVDHAQIISDQIVRRLPQYTLHNGTHLFNVLSIMEELLPEETLRALTPLECALCILAAFTHDLGMVMLDEDVKKYQETTGTPENQEWRRHCDAYPEELRQIERWKKIRDREPARASEANHRISYLEGHLLAEFIRKHHADQPDPILHWLNRLEEEAKNKALFCYGRLDFKHHLAQIGVSHGQHVSWLREKLVQDSMGKDFRSLTRNERANLFPGLLVRLADIMDFDASRAPGILYRHFGIENAVSILEWNKHMAITGWGLEGDTLTYEADTCEHPVYEKAIRGFVSAIKREVESVKGELSWQKKQRSTDNSYELHLPEFVQANIRAAFDEQHRPVYEFHDLQFELDQYEIQQLLMGESLYADPTLCLRELLQNALDALQMRDLRLKVLAKDPDACVEPTDVLRPGEALQVKVTWGQDSATDWEYIRVSDSGCGMTCEVLERYFTKLGKSYYRSPEYERERQILREHGFIVSPISQFGIGFLSCFMLADEIRIRTRPGHATKYRPAYDVRLSGSGSLFWLSPGTLERQGTEITLYLKQPFQLDHDHERAIRWLKGHFKYSEQHGESEKEGQALEQQKRVDPLWIIGRYVIWPLFPILLHPADHADQAICLDDRFHGDVLAPIAIEAVIKKAAKWDFPASALGQPRWEYLDWEDNQGDQATGTRIRLMFPYHLPASDPPLPLDPPSDSSLMRAHELAVFIETTLDISKTRKRITIKGITIDNLDDICARMLPVSAGIGTRLWVDLRGAAAPCLTVDRKTALAREDVDDWSNVFQGIFQRWFDRLQGWLDQHASRLTSGLLSAFAIESKQYLRASATVSLSAWRLKTANRSASWVGCWFTALLNQEIACALGRDLDLGRAFTLVRDYNHRLDRAHTFDRAHTLDRAHAGDFDLSRARYIHLQSYLEGDYYFGPRDRTQGRDLDLMHDLDTDLALVGSLARARYLDTESASFSARQLLDVGGFARLSSEIARIRDNYYTCWRFSLMLHLLPEAFASDLSRSLPALGVCGLKGRAGDGWLVAPGWIEWDVDPVTAEVRRESPKQHWSQYLIDKNYDLVFPLTHIPLGRLRRDCQKWRSDRSFHASGVLAYFLLGSEEWLKEQRQEYLNLFKVPHIHALMPKPELWLKRFDNWTETDWNTCGLSALWDIESGVVYWAEGAHHADDMKRVGKPIQQLIDSKA